MNRRELTKKWRKAKVPGRLYWRSSNQRWRDWETGAIAVSIDDPVRVWFYTLEAIEDEIEMFSEPEKTLTNEGPCPHCGRYGADYEPDTQRQCGCPDTERVICAHCGEYLGLAQYDPCDCAKWTCEGDDALAYEEWDGEL